MDDVDYAYSVFQKHFSLRATEGPWVGAEIGPGDSVFSTILAHDQGATAFWLVDAGDFADRSVDRYVKMASSLEERGLLRRNIFKQVGARDFDDLLGNCNSYYLTDGVDSLTNIPADSVDLIWSHAVLEHIRVARFSDFCKQTYRILRPGGHASHQVDFKDHLAAGLNNLRFSSNLWEREWFASKSGFYTNRISPSKMKTAFKDAGFNVTIINQSSWDCPPISRAKLAREFMFIDNSDLLISGIHFLLTKQ